MLLALYEEIIMLSVIYFMVVTLYDNIIYTFIIFNFGRKVNSFFEQDLK